MEILKSRIQAIDSEGKSLSVLGVKVVTAADTLIEDPEGSAIPFSRLHSGWKVKVKGTLGEDGALQAAEIKVRTTAEYRPGRELNSAIRSLERRIETRTEILNYLASWHSYRSYLEIGVADPRRNFDRIQVPLKVGVDPSPRGQLRLRTSSDDFFKLIDSDATSRFDLIFIDGLHLEQQVLRDVHNSLAHLAFNGTLVLHDCNPPDEKYQVEDPGGPGAWTGTVWKAFARLRMTRHDLCMYVVDVDWGVGVITRGHQELFTPMINGELTYDFLEQHRKRLLNVISVDEFVAARAQWRADSSGER